MWELPIHFCTEMKYAAVCVQRKTAAVKNRDSEEAEPLLSISPGPSTSRHRAGAALNAGKNSPLSDRPQAPLCRRVPQ